MISGDLLVTGRFIYCYLLCNKNFSTAKTQLLSSSEYCQWDENQNTIHGLTHDINSMPKLLYTWYFEKFTASGTSSSHSALRLEVSRICTILSICNKLHIGLTSVTVDSNIGTPHRKQIIDPPPPII